MSARLSAMDVAPAAADPRRPLFLGRRVRARVDADGPALRVRAHGRAETRYPLARVSRVIASPRVDWGAEALRACLGYGIPIVIVGDDGAPLGSLQPAQARFSRLAEDLEELLERPDWREVYAIWLRAARMRLLAGWREQRRAEGAPPGPGEFGELVRRHVYCAGHDSPFADATGLWRGALYALVAGAIRRSGLQPVYWGSGGDALELLRDLTRLLELRLRLEVHEGMESGLEGEAVVLRVFHALSATLEAEAERIVSSLARRVKQVLAEWR
jgi:hypothetical protein